MTEVQAGLSLLIFVTSVLLGVLVRRYIYNSGQIAGYRKGFTAGYNQGAAETIADCNKLMKAKEVAVMSILNKG